MALLHGCVYSCVLKLEENWMTLISWFSITSVIFTLSYKIKMLLLIWRLGYRDVIIIIIMFFFSVFKNAFPIVATVNLNIDSEKKKSAATNFCKYKFKNLAWVCISYIIIFGVNCKNEWKIFAVPTGVPKKCYYY